MLNQLETLKTNLPTSSLEKTLKKMFDILSEHAVDAEATPFIQAHIASVFENLLENWQKQGKKVLDLKKGIEIFFESEKETPAFLKRIRASSSQKRQPDLIESIFATLERFEMMERLEPVFEGPCTGMIVGGSLAYGPFYNVRSGQDDGDSSDIDVLFVLDQHATDKDWDDLLYCPHFATSAKQDFIARKDIFLQVLLPKGEADILSQKFHVQGTDIEISAHFFTDKALDDLLIKNLQREIRGSDKIVAMKDYKSELFPHATCLQINFDGVTYPYVVPEQKSVMNGIIAELPAYIVRDRAFYPGIYQNLILPSFFIFHDRDGSLTDNISMFKEAIKNHIRNTYGSENVETRLLRSHLRHELFPGTLKDTIKS